MLHADITERVIGCAYAVYNKMGFGFLESVYEKCMAIELAKSGIPAQTQFPLSVFYDGLVVGEFVADIAITGKLIVELKSVRRLLETHEVQLVNYLTATQTPVGLLLNFGPSGVQVKRKLRTLDDDLDHPR